MKLSNERIINDAAKLKEIAQKQLPIKVSYALAKNIAKIDSELKIYNKEREKLIDKYAEKDEKGNIISYENGNIKIKYDCIEDFNKDNKELLEIENEIEIHQFNFSLLDGYNNISAAELMAIDYMIEE
ncbi:hypothetical protein [Clostridium sp. 'White wine YQ']|uniref:hypothetical protein n=1 Tax=Clostridium sp. 'White wine YQ' TaxID=3027474 RepID=UPI002365C428|nr:hypothetical protein [Clostridium sp. 'White wine YQ']MDD7793702.1 hypothetical protein [Clostridium sp. 'White wine YQ']